MEALIIDCKTQTESRRAFTLEEIFQRDLDTVAALAEKEARQQAAQRKAEAIAELKTSANKDTQDLLIAFGIE